MGLRRDPTLPNRIADEVGRIMHVELLHESSTMKLRRLYADMQHFRDLLGRLPFSDELEHLALARCQGGPAPRRGRRASVYDCLGCAGADVQPAAPHFLYSVDQVVRSLAFL